MVRLRAMKSIQVQDLGRVREIAQVLARNGFGHVFQSVGLSSVLPSLAEAKEPTKPYARRLRQVLIELGPTFVKLGQVLSVRPDILPKDVLLEFQALQDRVPPVPYEEGEQALEAELHRPISEVFAELDEEPLGSASVAQAHRGRLLDGREVAIKIQRPGIERTIRSDIAILYSLANLVEGRIEIPGFYTPVDIVREFDGAITRELDFLAEARAASRMRANFADSPDIVIPEVYARWSTRRLLVMEMIHGVPLKERLARAEETHTMERALAHRLMDATYRQVFDHGYFHGDPHPGNIFVTDDDRIAFLDFGVTGMLTGAMQDTIVNVFTAMVFRDPEMFAMTVYRAGASDDRIDLRAFREGCERLMVKYHGASLDDIANPTTLIEVVQLAARFRINLPSEYAVLARAIGLIEGAIRVLLPGVDIVSEVTPYAQRLMRQRFSPERVAGDAARLMLQFQTQFKDLPTHLDQVLMDLERGNLTFVTKDPDAAALRQELQMGVLRLSLAAFASTLTLGALLFLAVWSPTPWGIPVFGLLGLALLGVGVSIFGALGLHVFFAKVLSLSFWRRRIAGLLRFFSWRRRRG